MFLSIEYTLQPNIFLTTVTNYQNSPLLIHVTMKNERLHIKNFMPHALSKITIALSKAFI